MDENQAQEILADLKDLLHNGNYPWDSEFADHWELRNRELEEASYYLNFNLEINKFESELKEVSKMTKEEIQKRIDELEKTAIHRILEKTPIDEFMTAGEQREYNQLQGELGAS